MRVVFFIALCAFTAYTVEADHMVVGNIANRVEMANHTVVEYNAFPFIKRVKSYFYTQTDNRPIVGIQALDLLHSKASITITSGGVGYPFVNLRMKSERGSGLKYDIGIYVSPYF